MMMMMMRPPLSRMDAAASTTAGSGRAHRRRSVPRAVFGLALCALLYAVIWDQQANLDDDDNDDGFHLGGGDRRQLAFLDPVEQKRFPYGRDMIDQNYQSLMLPSVIDSSMFRLQNPNDFQFPPYIPPSSSSSSQSVCDDVLVFMPQPFAHNGHGSQINSYILASLVATFENRAMVLLEPPNELNSFKSNSQFGCPPEAWRTETRRTGAEPVKVGWNEDFPVGITRLIRHPAWLSRGCSMPCFGERNYEEWDALRLANNATSNPGLPPAQIQCGGTTKGTNVVVMGGQEMRDYFDSYYRERMLDRSTDNAVSRASDWAERIGARPHEARTFVNSSALDGYRDTWDYVSALVARSGVLRFQPWIGRDVEGHMKTYLPDLDLAEPYDAVHVRRGDKLLTDARRLVRMYWTERGMYDEVTGAMPTDYIPFRHYLTQYENVTTCADGPRTVYVATDDPEVVKAEIADLPKDDDGHTLLFTDAGEPTCHRFRFIFSTYDAQSGYHLHEGYGKGSCEERYERNVASVADLMLLTRSDVAVVEFNSNWGRLVRTFRLRVNDSQRVMNGARPVLMKGEMRIAWGKKLPGPPGW